MQLENADLNLLKALEVLLEERHLTRAAARIHLSQSAMSRTLTRLRTTFGDELLVRTARGFELTPRARTIQRDLALVMPRLRSLVRGTDFAPESATDTVRLHLTDYAAVVVGHRVFRRVFRQAPDISVHAGWLTPTSFDDLEHGRADLVLAPVRPPAPLRWQPLFEERFVCVLSRDHPITAERLTMADLARYPHASVVVLGADRMLVESRLAALGVTARPGLRVPFFTGAIAALPGTPLIAVLPSRLVAEVPELDVRIAAAPEELEPFTYGMTWHPRLDADPLHEWLRSLVQEAALELDLIDDPDDPSGSDNPAGPGRSGGSGGSGGSGDER
ncbi:LysR family transcriptional regulator [Amycolatopsis rhabdoformis]|uniref:LysR family transcriptional regulator n=1 Tax=Amycolatopsis rhabdoformis TaxID=1448059 RepID=A0ABZ1IHS6_9PSEU|nr:LysR family transcriptional regulator [Amycolatopsis rhabdoformis]WSE33326.1 LysR family transcriptional regulator [Amycolatopsis rhabdoformis]